MAARLLNILPAPLTRPDGIDSLRVPIPQLSVRLDARPDALPDLMALTSYACLSPLFFLLLTRRPHASTYPSINNPRRNPLPKAINSRRSFIFKVGFIVGRDLHVPALTQSPLMRPIISRFLLFGILVMLLILAAGSLQARPTGQHPATAPELIMRVSPRDNGAAVDGVIIKLYKDTLLLQESATIKPDGWEPFPSTISFHLKSGSKYMMVLSKKGYIKTIINIDTNLPDDIASDQPFITDVDVKMLKAATHPDLQDSDFPLALIQYDKDQKKFICSKKYAGSVRIMLQSK
jgi:hypothetical protein